jgi:hypothetical protein
VVFGTAGNEDFNYLEMRRLDRELTSPHHLAVFVGGHVWLSSELAMEAVEWLEIQAMKSGREPRDQARIDGLFDRRRAAAEGSDKDAYVALEAIIADFAGLKDTSALAARAEALGRDKRVRDALKKDREEEAREQRQTDEIIALERQLSIPEERPAALVQLRDRWKKLAAAADAEGDSVDRRMARRIQRGLSMGAADRVQDPAYLKVIEAYRPPRSLGR